MLGLPSLHHKHHVVLFIFTIFLLEAKDSEFYKNK